MHDIDKFMEGNRDRNKLAGIASILLSTNEYYLHLIEGHRTDVNGLYNIITKDTHHFNCTLLRYIEVKKREFHNWYAEHVSISEFDTGSVNLLLPLGAIEIDSISAAQAVTMIRRIHAHLQVRHPNINSAHTAHD